MRLTLTYRIFFLFYLLRPHELIEVEAQFFTTHFYLLFCVYSVIHQFLSCNRLVDAVLIGNFFP